MSRGLIDVAMVTVRALRELALVLEEEIGDRPDLVIADLAGELPVNRSPDHHLFKQRDWSWWFERPASEITGITIHHTLSHSPQATAAYCSRPASRGGKGYPSIQYHYWVAADDKCTVYRCAPVTWAIWHDHTGAYPTTISVGLAGHLHLHAPPDDQIEMAARLVRQLMAEFDVDEDQVRGHTDRYAGTICPGWYRAGWRDRFVEALRSV